MVSVLSKRDWCLQVGIKITVASSLIFWILIDTALLEKKQMFAN